MEGHGNEESSGGSNNPSTSLEVQQHVPLHPRTDSDLLRRILNDTFLRSIQNYNDDEIIRKTIKELSSYLDKVERRKTYTHGAFQTSSGRMADTLQNLSPRYKNRYQVLLQRVAEWKPKREAAIQSLSTFISKLDFNFKASTVVRLVSSTVDVSGSVAGLLFRSEEASWATHALNAASYLGLCGLVSTVAEVEMSKRILDEVPDIVEEDHKLLQPILSWFEESRELDAAVEGLFPYDIDKNIVLEIKQDAEEVDQHLQIFKAVLLSNVRRNNTLLSNNDFLHSLNLFSRSEVAPLWWNRILYRKHPIILDSSRMALQMEFGQIQSVIFQCIPALPLEQQKLGSLPVAGRIMLNLLTMYDSLVDLNKGTRSMHSDKLKRQLEKMAEELAVIESTVRKVQPLEVPGERHSI